MANDIITHLDDVPVQGLALDQAVEKMRGPENSNVPALPSANEARLHHRAY